MSDDLIERATHVPPLTDLAPDELLAIVAKGVTLVEPVVGHFATICANLAKEQRLQVEAQLLARLQTLARYFDKLDELRARAEVARDSQYQALMVLLEMAQASGDHLLIAEGMRCFQEYVRNSPALTRDFVEAFKAFEVAIK